MADYVTLSCPSCGAKLQSASDIERFACGYCGTEQLIKRSGGIVTIAPILEGIKLVQVGVDKTASELAIQRLEKEIDELDASLRAIGLLTKRALTNLDAAGSCSSMILALERLVAYHTEYDGCHVPTARRGVAMVGD